MSKNMAVLNENKQVINIIVCSDEELETPYLIAYTDANPAYIGGDFLDTYFYAPQPYPSWTRDKGVWVAPTPKPDNSFTYYWNELDLAWELVDFADSN